MHIDDNEENNTLTCNSLFFLYDFAKFIHALGISFLV
jgi:hypothetical protein